MSSVVINDGWHTGPDDGYFLESIVRHAIGAGLESEARAFMLSYAWISAKFSAAGLQSLENDCLLLAHDQAIEIFARAGDCLRTPGTGKALSSLRSWSGGCVDVGY